MQFQVLSHAGLKVSTQSTMLVFDPWLIGSCYWRSWWNYPPPPPAMLAGLTADAVYLTHVHWDHFHGPSLRKYFKPETTFYVPRGHYRRIRRDLEDVGYRNVVELRHGETVQVGPGMKLTSYQFFPFLDSAAVVEADGVTLLNANDAKLMGAPLRQVLDRHPHLDFVFRSHSSANGRLCYEVVDDPTTPVDNPDAYIETFTAFVRTTGARWAIPLASNHCFLHREVFDLNHTVTTPDAVARHFEAERISYPRVKVMVSGDQWSSDEGFAISDQTALWFTEREQRLRAYRDQMSPKLEAWYAREDRTRVSLSFVQRWLDRFHAALPAPVRLLWRHHPVTFVLTHGETQSLFRLDLSTGVAEQLTALDPSTPRLEVHTSALIFKQCCALDLFSHLQISKRVRFVVTRNTRWRMELLNHLWELYDYDYLPLDAVDWPRMAETWALRWREVALWARVFSDLAAGRGFDQAAWIRAARPELGSPG